MPRDMYEGKGLTVLVLVAAPPAAGSLPWSWRFLPCPPALRRPARPFGPPALPWRGSSLSLRPPGPSGGPGAPSLGRAGPRPPACPARPRGGLLRAGALSRPPSAPLPPSPASACRGSRAALRVFCPLPPGALGARGRPGLAPPLPAPRGPPPLPRGSPPGAFCPARSPRRWCGSLPSLPPSPLALPPSPLVPLLLSRAPAPRFPPVRPAARRGWSRGPARALPSGRAPAVAGRLAGLRRPGSARGRPARLPSGSAPSRRAPLGEDKRQ